MVFQANDQSQWGSGSEFTFDDERFLGLDTADSGSGGGFINYSYNYDVKVGFNSDLHFGGGQIDADMPWNLDFKTIVQRGPLMCSSSARRPRSPQVAASLPPARS